MPDCHVDTHGQWTGERWMHRAEVIRTSTGTVMYVTWPYRSEVKALARAWRWIHEEAERHAGAMPGKLFAE